MAFPNEHLSATNKQWSFNLFVTCLLFKTQELKSKITQASFGFPLVCSNHYNFGTFNAIFLFWRVALEQEVREMRKFNNWSWLIKTKKLMIGFTVNPCMYISVPEPSRQNGNGPIFLEGVHNNGWMSTCDGVAESSWGLVCLEFWTGVLRTFSYLWIGSRWWWCFTCMFVPTHRTGPCFHSPQSHCWCSKACRTANTETHVKWNEI